MEFIQRFTAKLLSSLPHQELIAAHSKDTEEEQNNDVK